jgi:hypothetical protein
MKRRERTHRAAAWLAALFFVVPTGAAAQDTTAVQDALYDRPFIGSAGRTSIGGYVEANTNYFVTEGISDGFSMELRRFNVFLFSAISRHIRFISELEFEHGTEEIALETALIDFQLNPAFTLRGGILLPPIGAFNQSHDSPLWEFVERPLVSTEIIPSTLSEIGAGFNGRLFRVPMAITYDLYLTNGLGDGVVSNEHGRTHLASGKRSGQFEEDNNGSPALSGRLAARHTRIGEIGFSFYTGIYNTYREEGEIIDAKRRLSIMALDFRTEVRSIDIRGELALAQVNVQDDLEEVFGERQWGGHVDVVAPVWRLRLLGYDEAVLNANLRLEAIDYNSGRFSSTGRNIFDELYAIVPGVSFRPAPDTVFRMNYRRHWYRDLVGNPAVRTAGVQVGFATYF